MVFCAFLDPESINAVDDGGGVGSDHLIGVMRCLLESCFVAETASYRIQAELKHAILELPDQDVKLRLGALLEKFATRDRFVEVVDDTNFEYTTPIREVAVAQCQNPLLDVVITEGTTTGDSIAEFVALSHFHRSNFAQHRQRLFSDGVEVAPGELAHKELFARSFGRMLMHGGRFTIEDYKVGHDFKKNYEDNLVYWDAFFKSAKRALTVTIQTELICLDSKARLEERLETLSSGSSITYRLQGATSPRHERFFKSQAFSLNIGRGIDLCDKRGMNRDICIRFAK